MNIYQPVKVQLSQFGIQLEVDSVRKKTNIILKPATPVVYSTGLCVRFLEGRVHAKR
jgi:hypothetical protein